MHPLERKKVSQEAEDFVANILSAQKWTVLARNFRRVGTEIDIIAYKQRTIVFVEVKHRKQLPTTQQDLNQIMTWKKRKALERGALIFLGCKERELPEWETLRFDLALVSPKTASSGELQLKYLAGI
jgi:Holliday junction resolvase-like predicted endonuclease